MCLLRERLNDFKEKILYKQSKSETNLFLFDNFTLQNLANKINLVTRLYFLCTTSEVNSTIRRCSFSKLTYLRQKCSFSQFCQTNCTPSFIYYSMNFSEDLSSRLTIQRWFPGVDPAGHTTDHLFIR